MSVRFSITMPAFDAATTIRDAVDSVLGQTFSDWELIVVDDGSTDDTAAIVSEYASRDDRISLIRQSNAGASVARNVAWQHASGEMIVRFDADDMLLPEYLGEFDRFISAHPGYDIYACNAWRVKGDGSRVLYHASPRFSHVFSLTVEDMLRESQIFTAAVSPKGFLEREGGYRPGVYVEEYDFWLRAMAKGARHIYLPEPLVLYRDHAEGQITADVVRIHESQIAVLRDVLASGLLTEAQAGIARRSIRLLEQNVRFRRTAARLLGRRGAEKAVAASRRFAWLLRPYRWLRR